MKNISFSIFVFFSIILFCSLGTWQIYRLQWKLNLINEIKIGLDSQPIYFSKNKIKNYQRVFLEGDLDFNKQIFLYSLNKNGTPGYDIITPLKTVDGLFILVNRGWIEKGQKNDLKKINIIETNKYEGIIKKITRSNPFKPKNDIKNNEWILNDVLVFKPKDGVLEKKEYKNYSIISIYDYEKITNLFKNFDTLSFLDLILNYQNLENKGYNKEFLNQSLHSMLTLPFFLFLMTALSSVLTLNTLKKSDNLKFIVLGLIISVLIFYFKDLSLALGQTERIPLILAIWAPVIALSFFIFIGVLQINEK